MSAFGMKPSFADEAGWKKWRKDWTKLFRRLSASIRAKRAEAKAAQRSGDPSAARKMADLSQERAMGAKLMMLLDEGRKRIARIRQMKTDIAAQMASFPLTLTGCQHIDMHFNKASAEFPDIPMWTLKAKGKTYYLHHIEANAPWSTRETPDASTKGSIRFKHCDLELRADGSAVITKGQVARLAA